MAVYEVTALGAVNEITPVSQTKNTFMHPDGVRRYFNKLQAPWYYDDEAMAERRAELILLSETHSCKNKLEQLKQNHQAWRDRRYARKLTQKPANGRRTTGNYDTREDLEDKVLFLINQTSCSDRRIADHCGVSIGTVNSIRHAARKRRAQHE